MSKNRYKKIFLGQDGNKILAGWSDDFGEYFDWVMIPMGNILIARKKMEIPKTIYLKTDFLNLFVDTILPSIKNEFILITGASDFSPEVNFNRAYNILISSPKVKFWFMNNMRNKTEKSFSLPAGLGAGVPGLGPVPGWNEERIDKAIIKIRNSINISEKIKDRIFCSFRERTSNVAGQDMVIRPAIFEIVNRNKNFFDIFEPMDTENFIRTLGKYKYSLCPHGNGLDPSPTMWLSLAVNTIPVIFNTANVRDMFSGKDSVIFFNKFEEIINKNLYSDRPSIDFEFLTCEYWANKIKSKIS